MNEKISKKIILDRKKKLELSLKKHWADSVQKPEFWKESGERNLLVARYLHKKYIGSSKKIEKMSNEFKSYKISNNTYKFTSIYKNVVMQYGFALECFVKALLIKNKSLQIFSREQQDKLSDGLLNHISINFYIHYRNILPVLKKEEFIFIDNLHRAVLAGKYPFEKEPQIFKSYTGTFDETIIFCNKLIKKIKKLLA